MTGVASAIRSTLERIGAAPARVRVISKAIAKTHRPDALFSIESCPIIGAGRLGELFIRMTPAGLDALMELIQSGDSKPVVKALSSIETIEPITPSYTRHNLDSTTLLRRCPRGEHGFLSRVRLFDLVSPGHQTRLDVELKATCARRGIRLTPASTHSAYLYQAEVKSADDIEALSSVVGVRSVTRMPLVHAITPKMLNVQAVAGLPNRKDFIDDCPVVVVVDSGIASTVPELESWVLARESSVAAPYRNTDHGTFVAGLICFGGRLNPTVNGLDTNPCGIVDLQVLPNANPDRGDISTLSEAEFTASLEAALIKYGKQYKTWNLSLGTDDVCSLEDFSVLARDLDNLQERYQVSFVISAGNYTSPPLLPYPRHSSHLVDGRITSPADSVLGITVGAISHVDYKQQGPPTHHPSAFSRHGSGPNHIIKPDLVHYGGACSLDGTHLSGIRSLFNSGTAEDIGTSFATPLVARTLAQIYHHVAPTPSPVLARALLTHHARDPRTDNRVSDGDENYFGFGLPKTVPYCLECTPHSSTLVFNDVLRYGHYLEWNDFPYPPSLQKNGRYFGDVWMTIAFSPARGERWGAEYCETHVDAKCGVYYDKKSRKTGKSKETFKGLVPPEHKNPSKFYESLQVEQLRKWAPVRTYYGSMGEKGQRGKRWRLKVGLLTRHDIEDKEAFKPQEFSLLVTIADPLKQALVYDEMAQIIRTRFQSENLIIRPAAQVRTKP